MRAARGVEADIHEYGAPPEPELGEYERLNELLDRLGPPRSEVIRLKHYEECTFEEIGRALGCSSNTAKTQYYRGLRWLREEIQREAGP